jgi:hypothetical protein
MRDAALLSGPNRYKTYGSLDISMMNNNPPWAVRNVLNDRILLSSKVGCFVFSPIFTVDLAAACSK